MNYGHKLTGKEYADRLESALNQMIGTADEWAPYHAAGCGNKTIVQPQLSRDCDYDLLTDYKPHWRPDLGGHVWVPVQVDGSYVRRRNLPTFPAH